MLEWRILAESTRPSKQRTSAVMGQIDIRCLIFARGHIIIAGVSLAKKKKSKS